MMACLRAPLEFCHNHRSNLFIDMFFSLLLTFYKFPILLVIFGKNSKKPPLSSENIGKKWSLDFNNSLSVSFLCLIMYIFTPMKINWYEKIYNPFIGSNAVVHAVDSKRES